MVEKARLLYQEFNDKGHKLMKYATTVQRASQRLLLSLCEIDSELKLFSRDISQEYVQADTNIYCPIFFIPPEILGLPEVFLLRVERPLYGLMDA